MVHGPRCGQRHRSGDKQRCDESKEGGRMSPVVLFPVASVVEQKSERRRRGQDRERAPMIVVNKAREE